MPGSFRFISFLASALVAVTHLGLAGTDVTPRLKVLPTRIDLRGQELRHGIVVLSVEPDGAEIDVTRESTFASTQPQLVSIDGKGQCRAMADGEAIIDVTHHGETVRVPVAVQGMQARQIPSFRQDIEPLLTKAGCNAGGCHGKLAGQNGFRLSLRAFAPEWDHEWLTREVNGRRINVAFPAESLILRKAIGAVPHEGGGRFREESRFYETLLSWIAARAPGPIADEPGPERLEILPGDRQLRPGDRQQLLIRAIYADGRVRDVTWLAQFFSNDETIVTVKPDGLVKALRPGETAVRVHFQDRVEAVRFTMAFPTDVAGADFTTSQNALDEPIFKKLKALRIPPSPQADDASFFRRVFLDTIGTLPSPDEVTEFLADSRADKRSRLIDSLLERAEYIDYWTLQLADLLQNRKERDHDVRGTKGVRSFHAWLRAQLAANRSWKEIANSVLLASGDVVANPAVGYYVTTVGEKQRVEESELPDSVAQSFLGTRIGCARCHNHPLEKYTQDDFYRFAAFFSRVALRREKPETGLTVLSTVSREESEQRKRLEDAGEKLAEAEMHAASIGEEAGAEEAQKQLAERRKQSTEAMKRLAEIVEKIPGVNQPRTGKMMAPRTLDGTAWRPEPGADLRAQFVSWMVGSQNFSGAMVNRLWKHFFGVGLVEPVDDLRASNPPGNIELWGLLNREFIAHDYDLKHVVRLILNSRAYQLSSETLPGNETDRRFYSHYYARRLSAEVLLDAIAGATGAPNKFDGYPLGIRAIQLPEPQVGSYFLTLFGRSDRVTACACERQGEVTLPQLLHLHNSDDLQQQIDAANGRLAALVAHSEDAETVEAIFLATLSRKPRTDESATIVGVSQADDRRAVFADLFWALINSKEFAFNH